ncbi:hypothetical protein N7486_009617 [Penicillium sp. IBT 16267x]|nr:hypothetical protein N7486_009617 [Penicillium sp. IBT 16267x]
MDTKAGTVVAPPHRRDSMISATKIATKIAKKDFIKKWLHTTPRKVISAPAKPKFTLEKPDFTPGDFMKHMCVDFTAMIQEAIKNSPSNKQSTRGICKEIMRTNVWYRTHQNAGWQEIVAQELANNPIFHPLIECHNGKISRTRSVKWALSFAAHPSTTESASSDTNTDCGWNVQELSDTSTAVDSSTETAHRPPQRSSTEASCTTTSSNISRSTEYEIQVPPEDLAELPATCIDAELPGNCIRNAKCESWERTYSISRTSTFETHEGERSTERPFSMSEITLVSPISPQSPNRFSPVSFAAFPLYAPAEPPYHENHISGPPPKYVDIPRKLDESFHLELEYDPPRRGRRISLDMPPNASHSPRHMTASPISRITQIQEDFNWPLAPETPMSSSALPSATSKWPLHRSDPEPSETCPLKRGTHVKKPKEPANMQQREEIGRWIKEIPSHSQTRPTPPDSSTSHLIRYQLHDTPMWDMEDEETYNNGSSTATHGGNISGIGDSNASGEQSPPKKGGRPPPQENKGTGRDDDGNQDRKRKRLHSPDRDERRRFASVTLPGITMNTFVEIALYSFPMMNNAKSIPSSVPFASGALKKNVGKSSTVPGSLVPQFRQIHVCSNNQYRQDQNGCTN